MAFTQLILDELLANREPEGLYWEFKRGAALSPVDGHRTELVKDCTGFANAAGGVIVYGIAEQEVDGIRVAAVLDPVTDPRTDQNWIAEVLRSNTSPPISRFHVTELPQQSGGRVVAVEIEQGSTAHQSLRDHRYYQRTGPTTAPMVDFQIRDVIGRRSKPDAAISVRFPQLFRSREVHRSLLHLRIENTGPLTLEKWWLDVDIPAAVVRDTTHGQNVVHVRPPNYQRLVRTLTLDGKEVIRIGLGDPWFSGERLLVRPGQMLEFDRNSPIFSEIVVEVAQDNYRAVEGMPVHWTFFFQNCEPKREEVRFNEWCQF